MPGRVVGLQGSAMYQVQLSNNHVIVRHVDQLRHCVCQGETIGSSEEDISVTGTGTETVEPESTGASRDSSEVLGAPETQETPPSTQTPETDSPTTEESTEDFSSETGTPP